MSTVLLGVGPYIPTYGVRDSKQFLRFQPMLSSRQAYANEHIDLRYHERPEQTEPLTWLGNSLQLPVSDIWCFDAWVAATFIVCSRSAVFTTSRSFRTANRWLFKQGIQTDGLSFFLNADHIWTYKAPYYRSLILSACIPGPISESLTC